MSGRRQERVKDGHETVLRLIEHLTKKYGAFNYVNNFPEKQVTEQNSGSYGKPDLDLFLFGKHQLAEVKGMQAFWRTSGSEYEKRGKLALTRSQWDGLVALCSGNGGEPCVIVEIKTRCTKAPYVYFMLNRETMETLKMGHGEWISPSVWEIIASGEKL